MRPLARSALTVIGYVMLGFVMGAAAMAYSGTWRAGLLTLLPYLGGIVAVWSLVYQQSRARYSMGIDLILKMEERFDERWLRDARKRAATALLAAHPGKSDQAANQDIETVLNFFEGVGFLLERGAIDGRAAWEFFHHWVVGYYHATVSYRTDPSGDSGALFANFKLLYKAVAKIENKALRRGGKRPKPYQDAEVEEFLADEIRLRMGD